MCGASIEAVFTGLPKQIVDDRGTWTSSIFRTRVDGPVPVTRTGLRGDRVAQPYHGGEGAAVCVHLAEHYEFWNAHYGTALQAGAVGENVTLRGLGEENVCVGDRIRLGTALVEVSGPRIPCTNLARRIGRADWIKLTIRENRTGFYMRVLEPGLLQAGNTWTLEDRQNPHGAIPAINRCIYLDFDPAYAKTLLEMPGLAEPWKDLVREKLNKRGGHWTATVAG